MPWTTPKTDWDTNPTNPLPSDFNRIEGNIDFLNTDIETKKGLIVDALNSVGIAALIADTHVQLASKITSAEKTGVSITPGTVNKEIPKGIYDTGGGTVLGDPDLISANIKAGINIFGVAGNSNVVDTSSGTAVAADILSGKVAFVDGAQVNGSMVDRGTVNQTLLTQGQQYTIPEGKHGGSGKVTASFANLIADNIKNGVNIGGVVGTLIQALAFSAYTAIKSFSTPATLSGSLVPNTSGVYTYTKNHMLFTLSVNSGTASISGTGPFLYKSGNASSTLLLISEFTEATEVSGLGYRYHLIFNPRKETLSITFSANSTSSGFYPIID
jgi:hypothetical protein